MSTERQWFSLKWSHVRLTQKCANSQHLPPFVFCFFFLLPKCNCKSERHGDTEIVVRSHFSYLTPSWPRVRWMCDQKGAVLFWLWRKSGTDGLSGDCSDGGSEWASGWLSEGWGRITCSVSDGGKLQWSEWIVPHSSWSGQLLQDVTTFDHRQASVLYDFKWFHLVQNQSPDVILYSSSMWQPLPIIWCFLWCLLSRLLYPTHQGSPKESIKYPFAGKMIPQLLHVLLNAVEGTLLNRSYDLWGVCEQDGRKLLDRVPQMLMVRWIARTKKLITRWQWEDVHLGPGPSVSTWLHHFSNIATLTL